MGGTIPWVWDPAVEEKIKWAGEMAQSLKGRLRIKKRREEKANCVLVSRYHACIYSLRFLTMDVM